MRRPTADLECLGQDDVLDLVDITPPEFACAMTMSCPAVLKNEKTGHYVIIGKLRDPNSPGLRGRVGDGEVALEISRELLEGALKGI
jgi:hypothetical protein